LWFLASLLLLTFMLLPASLALHVVSSADDFPALTGFILYCLRVAVVSALLCSVPGGAFTLSVAVVRAAFLLVNLVLPSPFLLLLYGLLPCFGVILAAAGIVAALLYSVLAC
jgi:hypothetical protein